MWMNPWSKSKPCNHITSNNCKLKGRAPFLFIILTASQQWTIKSPLQTKTRPAAECSPIIVQEESLPDLTAAFGPSRNRLQTYSFCQWHDDVWIKVWGKLMWSGTEAALTHPFAGSFKQLLQVLVQQRHLPARCEGHVKPAREPRTGQRPDQPGSPLPAERTPHEPDSHLGSVDSMKCFCRSLWSISNWAKLFWTTRNPSSMVTFSSYVWHGHSRRYRRSVSGRDLYQQLPLSSNSYSFEVNLKYKPSILAVGILISMHNINCFNSAWD